MVVNENDETGVDFNSFVEHPAHEKSFIMFDKDSKVKLEFNDEKRIITGVMISANQPIYRNENGNEFEVVFKPATIERIQQKFFKNNFQNNVNADHSRKKVFDGVTLIESYIISNSDNNKPKAPKAFASMNLKDGTWIASYKIDNDEIWKQAKEGKWKGFSVEVIAELKEVTNKTINMSKKEKSFWGRFKSKKQNFASAKSVDGSTYYYDGELSEGTMLFSDEEMTTPVTGDSLVLQLEDGTTKLVTMDGNGTVTAINEQDFDDAEADELGSIEEELQREVEGAIENLSDDASLEEVARVAVETVIEVVADADVEQFAKFSKFANHKVLQALKEAKDKAVAAKSTKKAGVSKFKANRKASADPVKKTWKDILSNDKK